MLEAQHPPPGLCWVGPPTSGHGNLPVPNVSLCSITALGIQKLNICVLPGSLHLSRLFISHSSGPVLNISHTCISNSGKIYTTEVETKSASTMLKKTHDPQALKQTYVLQVCAQKLWGTGQLHRTENSNERLN